MFKAKILSDCLAKSTTSWPVDGSSRMKFFIEGQTARPRKFRTYPPFSDNKGLRLQNRRILSPFFEYRMLSGISSRYFMTCGISLQQLYPGCNTYTTNFLGPPVWKRALAQTKVANSCRGSTPFSLASQGFSPGPKMLQTSPSAEDLTFPIYWWLVSSKMNLFLERVKVDPERVEVFLALISL